jgi:predicted nucleic acid-binding protein
MRPVIYDTAVLIAADRGERRVWAEHRVRLEAGMLPAVPSPVLAQASRSPKQVQMRRLLRGCEVVPLDQATAHAAGALLGKARTRDVVDATVAALAARHDADVVTADAADIRKLLTASGAKSRTLDV